MSRTRTLHSTLRTQPARRLDGRLPGAIGLPSSRYRSRASASWTSCAFLLFVMDEDDEPDEPTTWAGPPFPRWANSLSRLGLWVLLGVIVGPFTFLWFWVRGPIHTYQYARVSQ